MVPPDGGSRILFFSGGTALAPVAAELSRHTRNAVHVITTFDSGGSSAELRRAFDMPAVGDIRARIMALADRSLEGNPETVELLGYRLPKDAGPEALHRELASLASGAHPLVAAIPEPMNEVVTQHLSAFRSLMPVDMDLAGASIGNLILHREPEKLRVRAEIGNEHLRAGGLADGTAYAEGKQVRHHGRKETAHRIADKIRSPDDVGKTRLDGHGNGRRIIQRG